MWTWLIVIFAIAMVVGPIMLMQPSPGTARLAKIRTYASTLGLAVRLPSPLPSGEKLDGAIYSIPLSPHLRAVENLSQWRLRKLKFRHDIHFHENWDWEGKTQAEAAMHPYLLRCIKELPVGISAIELNGGGLGLLWDERLGEKTAEAGVDAIKQRLEDMMSHLSDVMAPQVEA